MSKAENPELFYARACLEDQLFSKDTIAIPPQGLDWEKLLAYLKSQDLAAYFYILGKHYGDLWPVAFRAYLQREYYIALIHGDLQRNHISQVLRAFNKAGISVIVLKGWAMIQTLYNGDHGQRTCDDVDILIRPQDIKVSEQILVQLGYKGEDEVWPDFSHRYSNGRLYFAKRTKQYLFSGLIVGLHWGLFHMPSYDPAQVNVSPLFESAKTIYIAEQPVLELSPEDQIVYLCSHLDLHHRLYNTLQDYYEIALFIKLVGDRLKWDLVLGRASDWQHTLSLKKVLNKLAALWPGIIPQFVIQKVSSIEIAKKEQKMDQLIDMCSDNNTLRTWLIAVTLQGWRKRFGFLVEQAFPSPNYMRERYRSEIDLPVFFIYLYRFSLAVKYSIQKLKKSEKIMGSGFSSENFEE